MSKVQPTVQISNRKAAHNFFISDTWEAGIMLTGTEIKAVREGKANLTDSFCLFRKEELWVRNIHISAYEHGGYNNHEPRRERKLLLHAHQLRKLQSKLREKGTAIIPVRMYINDRGFAKLEIGLARGKKQYDKRESMKQAEAKRELGRVMKRNRT
jgi:SsrA-binding protein